MTYIKAIAHPNFALIKYWGKSDALNNLPDMSSISITIDTLFSTAKVSFDSSLKKDLWVLNDIEQESLGQIKPTINYLKSFKSVKEFCVIESINNFPTAAGLASSASGVASIVIAINELFNIQLSEKELINAAILGSGSAPRSLYSGFVYLNKKNYSCETILDGNEWPLKIIICQTSSDRKLVSSRDGMRISKSTSSYYKDWVNDQNNDIKKALKAINMKNFDLLGEVSEDSCKKMHKVMETSKPPLIYRNSTTHLCIQKIEEMKVNGIDIFYTIDAGPQVKIICKDQYTDQVISEMKSIPNMQDIIEVNIGQGARLTNEG
ncbi:diphosphomevalonate decarboxylase [Gammaproteobacteria bacterium]|nr:diphosphomevalonate decarboxylase [Gammaproteobacteria bacterium]